MRSSAGNNSTLGAALRWGAVGCAVGVLIAVLPSCKVGPNYERPAMDVPATYKSATTAPTTEAAARLAPDWWKLFGDPTLNQLECTAVENNQNVQAAMARVLEARATANITKSQFYPTITANPTYTRSRSSGNLSTSTYNGTQSHTRNDFRVPIDLTYEVDVWGRVRRAYDQSKAQLQASADDFQVVLQTLESDVAQNYFNLRSFDAQYDIVSQNVADYNRQVELLQTQYKAGVVGNLDVLQAEALRDTALSKQEDLKRLRDDAEHALAVLLGEPPAKLSIPVEPFAIQPPVVPGGFPADLLRRRPDVAEAEQFLIAANANVGVQTANFYPVFTITGSAGFESADLHHLLDWESHIWTFAPNVSAPLFEGGKLVSNLELAKQQYNESVANYRQAVLTAFQDVEDALSDLHHYAIEAHAVDVAVNSSSEYLRLSNIQFKNGIINYLTVIDAERTLLNNQLTAAQVSNDRLISSVLLMKAMGGGWDSRDPASSQPAIPHDDQVAATRP
ncbi:MAG TPA: efflux transporter outer membrane subunit [Phycisphaerae bacterium]|nr:efflux transporter outer membrane subunit [Phycisphaerae bacterium]